MNAIDQAIKVLNRIHAADPTVMPALISHRVPCNEAVAADPAVQVGVIPAGFEVGILGIINGIFGCDSSGRGFIAADYDEGYNGFTLTRFVRLDAE